MSMWTTRRASTQENNPREWSRVSALSDLCQQKQRESNSDGTLSYSATTLVSETARPMPRLWRRGKSEEDSGRPPVFAISWSSSLIIIITKSHFHSLRNSSWRRTVAGPLHWRVPGLWFCWQRQLVRSYSVCNGSSDVPSPSPSKLWAPFTSLQTSGSCTLKALLIEQWQLCHCQLSSIRI